MKAVPILYLVIPCYNEEEVLDQTTKKLQKKLIDLISRKIISKESRVLYVDDGSKDNTWKLIEKFHQMDQLFTGICLSRNRGHQNALFAGLMIAKKDADIIISLDADLQDDINAMDMMIEKYQAGYEIVYGVRSSRKKDSWFKRSSAEGFYKLMQKMGVDIVFNHADYRLTTKKVLNYLENYQEVNLFLRGIFPLIGFSSTVVYYERKDRLAGESKYPLKKMLSFAWDGITSFSVQPIKLVLNLGILIFFVSVIAFIYCLVIKLLGNAVPGWTFLACSIWLVAGLEMLSLGIIGEYIGKIYKETKLRPRYIISRNLIEEEKENA